ncbi:multidrug transporter subunit MdtN [Saccharibacter sp. 17.LH.SD]|uniref:multidrug transporter subunit MdtN n=1 Tax=Saccharibacter sp. 17.LH.SD TaxID=2689393 RepID=UPI00136B94E7|nr:multidrug transporter subunit MdtN [Saccharibacter sp. 17.LH.SD]MXV44923.1 multidrug transporter subunit MdtN [Saccharibacter sp. 17.LH.SD]
MERIKLSQKRPLGLIIAFLCITAAIGTAFYIEYDSYRHPETESGVIDADVVHIGALVGGRLLHLPIHVNQAVRKGELLYQIDPEPYEIAVRNAEANLFLAQANLEEQQRQLSVRVQQAASSAKQLHQAEDDRDLAERTVKRLKPLALQHFIPWQEYDEAVTKLNSAQDRLAETHHSQEAANVAIGDLKRSEAARLESEAALEKARYDLRQTKVFSPVDGYVTSLETREGEVLAAHQILFTLVANDQWFAIANIREINLKPIHPGSCATIYSMIDRHKPIHGYVESIGWGVINDYIKVSPNNVPNIQRQMDWVHVAQRFPVRIRVDNRQPELLRMGATADIELLHGAACR